jgi:enoyl-CoA hydratase/carnithine racemase
MHLPSKFSASENRQSMIAEAPSVRFTVLETQDGRGIGRVSLDQPKSLNALTLPMARDIYDKLRQWRQDASICAVWLESTSERAFCAGGDLRTIYNEIRATGGGNSAYVAEFFAAEYRLDHLVHRYGKPVIAWHHGICMGGGIGLACGASNRIVTQSSQLAMPEISIGLFPDVGASWFLARIPGRIGRYLGLTGARMTPADALFAGLADLPVHHEKKSLIIDALLAMQWEDDWQRNNERVRRLLLGACDWTLARDSALAARAVELRRICSAATVKECAAAIEEWATRDEWAQPHARMLAEGSPISAVLAWELQKRLQHASLADAFRLEYAAALGCATADFPEGIRALIIDKDRAPQWQPSTLDGVSSQTLEDLLRPRWRGAHPLDDLEQDG